ncbi:MAG: hypothetical protein ACREMY_33980 [bacterium]
MKATIEIPDDLYRQIKARTATRGRSVRDVTNRGVSTLAGRDAGRLRDDRGGDPDAG